MNGDWVIGLLGVLAPLVNALFKRLGLGEKAQNALILGFCVVVAGFVAFAKGDIAVNACAGLDLQACMEVVYKYVGIVLVAAFVSYKMVWQALGIDDKIAGK